MKSLVLVLCLSLGAAVTAHAETIPGFYEKLKNRFENATTAPSMMDIPSVDNISALKCHYAYKDDTIDTTSIVKISKTVSAGPLEPPKVTERVVLASHMSDEVAHNLIDAITQRISQDVNGKTSLVVDIEETPYYRPSPMQLEFRKADYIYVKATNKKSGDVDYIYCYPSETAR